MRSPTLLSAGVLALCGTLLAVENPTFPILGGSFRQTMRIAITANSRAGCTAVAGFRNSLGQPPDPDRTLTLPPGHTGFMDMNLNRLVTAAGQRAELRPFVQVTAGECDGSVEVFELVTGRTTASVRLFTGLQPDTPGLQAPPDPEFPALGAVRGQMVRLGVARTKNEGLQAPPDPDCQAVLGFTDGTGKLVGPQKRIALEPGQFDFIDLDPAQVLGPAGVRATIRPVLLSAGGGMEGCHASAQVFEQATGWTSVVMQGGTQGQGTVPLWWPRSPKPPQPLSGFQPDRDSGIISATPVRANSSSFAYQNGELAFQRHRGHFSLRSRA